MIDNILFTHAGVNKGWIEFINRNFKHKGSSFEVNQNNIVSYIENEFANELKRETAEGRGWMEHWLESSIFNIGYARGGDFPYGGPFWSDFNDEYQDPDNWNLMQIFSHTQMEFTGSIGKNGNGYCIDSRAIFELDLNTKELRQLKV